MRVRPSNEPRVSNQAANHKLYFRVGVERRKLAIRIAAAADPHRNFSLDLQAGREFGDFVSRNRRSAKCTNPMGICGRDCAGYAGQIGAVARKKIGN
jgi:hypothetical protein